jgi:hypothetical protein
VSRRGSDRQRLDALHQRGSVIECVADFVFDTGASRSAVSLAFARACGLQVDATDVVLRAYDESISFILTVMYA